MQSPKHSTELFPVDQKECGNIDKYPLNPPSEWFDDKKMEVLFGPLNRDDKINFWKDLIHMSFSLHPLIRNRPVFSLNFLQRIFKRKGITPMGLLDVIKDMLNKGEIIYYEDYIRGEDRSFMYKVWNFIISNIMTQEIKPTDEFVLIQEIKELSDSFIERIKKSRIYDSNSIYLYDDLLKEFPEVEIILPYLKKNNLVIEFHTLNNYRAIKLFINKKKEEISIIDQGIGSLKCMERDLEAQISKISEEMESIKKEAIAYKKALKKKNAVNCMKKYKRLEMQLEKRIVPMERVSTLLTQIQLSQMSIDFYNTMKIGVKAMEEANNGVDVDEIVEMADNIKNLIEDQSLMNQEIDEAFNVIEDDEDYEKLLEELDEHPDVEIIKDKLPTVPEKLKEELKLNNVEKVMKEEVGKVKEEVKEEKKLELVDDV